MYKCPACGSGLKFDIQSQQLACDHCDSHYGVHDFDNNSVATEEEKEYEVTIYKCPQCGGELTGSDTEAAVFCSYCGSSNVLESRIGRAEKPTHIIPFKISKEECKKLFIKKVKGTGFAPKEITNDKVIESFRGIYMPYWKYTVTQKGDVHLRGEKSHRSGDYIIYDYYHISGEIDAAYDGFSKDASKAFDDNISDAIAPFNTKEMDEFTPAYMSGFYADIADVKSSTYVQDAKGLATRESESEIKRHPGIQSGLSITTNMNSELLHTKLSKSECVMYPVWFFSYRQKDRIAYAAVNGQTGKLMADVPISIPKYLTTSAILTIAIFFLLNVFFTFTPKTLLVITGILNILTVCLHFGSESEIEKRDGNKRPLCWQPMVAILLLLVGVAVWFISPVSDIWFYGTIIVNAIAVMFCMIDIITKYNLSSTRPLPQFNRTGGDDRA